MTSTGLFSFKNTMGATWEQELLTLRYFYGIRVVRLHLSVFVRVDHCLFLSDFLLFLLLISLPRIRRSMLISCLPFHKKAYHSVEKNSTQTGIFPNNKTGYLMK